MSQNNYVTKDDLKTKFQRFEKKMDQKFEEFAGKIISAVAKGFEETASKEDLKQTEQRLEKRIVGIENDVRDIKRGSADLKADAVTDAQIRNHDKKITRLENKVFAS